MTDKHAGDRYEIEQLLYRYEYYIHQDLFACIARSRAGR